MKTQYSSIHVVQRNWERSKIVERGITVGKMSGREAGLKYMMDKGVSEEVATRVLDGHKRASDPR
jgi:hypothetical protein